jgi:hypothetical protein
MENNQDQSTPQKWTYALGLLHSVIFVAGTIVLDIILYLISLFLLPVTAETGSVFSSSSETFFYFMGLPNLAFLIYVIYSLVKRRGIYTLGFITILGPPFIIILLFYILFAISTTSMA